MRILAIESSCDDLAACLFEGPDQILSSRVASQETAHAPYGGIVPEIASRQHLTTISQLVEKTIQEAPQNKQTFEGIAVTYMPGLVGSLLVGLNFAKGLALSRQVPFIGVNHLEGHLMSVFLEEKKPQFPFIGLVISGGHTNLYWVEGTGRYRLLGMTVDDAAGEAYDKVAKILGLGYPGGPILDRLAKLGNPNAVRFAIPRVKRGKLYTSFSGLKTAVLEYAKAHQLETLLKEKPITECKLALDLIASFQKIVVTIVEKMLLKASEELECKRWVITGGVACNSGLRDRLNQLAQKEGYEVFIPQPKFCTDNAAMIAYVGHAYLSQGIQSDGSLNAVANDLSSK
jgi:N6-L-threonylcarbamoyladenine synthase